MFLGLTENIGCSRMSASRVDCEMIGDSAGLLCCAKAATDKIKAARAMEKVFKGTGIST